MSILNFQTIGSGSNGNGYVLDDGTSRLMIEAGFSLRTLARCVGSLSGLDGCLISHEHQDHAIAAKALIERGLPVYCSRGTADALGLLGAHILQAGTLTTIGGYDALPFETHHDAAEPLGFFVRSRSTGERLGFITDSVTASQSFERLDVLAVECNHSEGLLEAAACPLMLKQRIQASHLSLERLLPYLQTLDLSRCRELWLLHMSDARADAPAFCEAVRKVVPASCAVRVADRGPVQLSA